MIKLIENSKEISSVLKTLLKTMNKYLTQEANELIINREKEIMLDKGEKWETIQDEELTLQFLESFIKELATRRNQTFNENNPSLSCELPYPYLRYRLQAQHKSVLFNSNIGISIRIPSKKRFTLESFILSEKLQKEWNHEKIKELVRQHKSILVSGGTGTGKTSFLNALASEIDQNERIVTIEDSQELSLKNHNILQLAISKSENAKYSYRMAIDNALRLRPDRLLLGEIDTRNTLPFLRASNTGHEGNLSTLHANTAKDALKAIRINIVLGGGLQNPDERILNSYIASGVDYIIQIKRIQTHRIITDILNLKETDLESLL